MQRYKLTIEYHGGGFVGWQRQSNGLAIQQVIEEAIAGYCGEAVTLYGAGRTDAGVHATGQVAHIELVRNADPDEVRDALNFHIRPYAIAIIAAETVGDEFHARFSARQRAYEYQISNRRAPLALEAGRCWWVPQPLDVVSMGKAAALLLGWHDFSTFRAANCQAVSSEKTLDMLKVHREGDLIRVAVRARSFLYQQVRIMVGTLKLVGEGKWSENDVSAALAAKDRTRGGPTAPPDGLYLTDVVY